MRRKNKQVDNLDTDGAAAPQLLPGETEDAPASATIVEAQAEGDAVETNSDEAASEAEPEPEPQPEAEQTTAEVAFDWNRKKIVGRDGAEHMIEWAPFGSQIMVRPVSYSGPEFVAKDLEDAASMVPLF